MHNDELIKLLRDAASAIADNSPGRNNDILFGRVEDSADELERTEPVIWLRIEEGGHAMFDTAYARGPNKPTSLHGANYEPLYRHPPRGSADYWQEEARRYAGDADYWRKRAEKAEKTTSAGKDGYVLVPAEPTEAMLSGLVGPAGYCSIPLVDAYKAMLAAQQGDQS